jgi:hypothetical protein
MALGSALASIGALLTVLALLLGWTCVPGPWDLLLGFATGLVAGMGAALALKGLIERRHEVKDLVGQ